MHHDQSSTPVEVITGHHRYTGLAVNRGFRISDVLNDMNVTLLEMHDTLAVDHLAACRGVRFDELLLRKDSILMVVPQGDHEAPLRRRNNYVVKERYGAMIALPGYILSGILSLPVNASPLALLAENSTAPRFLGMTSVTIHSSTHDLGFSQCDVAIVHRLVIESAQLTAQSLAKQGSS